MKSIRVFSEHVDHNTSITTGEYPPPYIYIYKQGEPFQFPYDKIISTTTEGRIRCNLKIFFDESDNRHYAYFDEAIENPIEYLLNRAL